jgi:hypothetical protein
MVLFVGGGLNPFSLKVSTLSGYIVTLAYLHRLVLRKAPVENASWDAL